MSYRKLSTTELHEAETHMTLGRKNVLLISGLHANGSVQPDHLAVDHWVLRQGRHQVGKLSGVSQAGGEGHLACEEGAHLLWKTGQEGRGKQTWKKNKREHVL